jgi:predicted dehydrogenase
MTDGRFRVGVVGVGYHGRHHARILSRLEGVRLAGVVDAKPARAAEVAAAHGTEPFSDFRDLLDRVDAVTVAVPTESHAAVAIPFLQRGLPVLVEKPLARSVEEADAMIAAARQSGAVFGVGHTERHNPAVAAALPLVTAPKFIEVHRLGTFPERSLEIDVVFDLMIHDLDVILVLAGSDVTGIEAVGVPVLTPRIDIANARLRFASGCIANVTASRISRERVRKLRFFQPDQYLSIDCAARELEVYRIQRRFGGFPTIEGGKVPVDTEEPLARELKDFVEAARTHRPPLVTADEGRRALALAERISERITSTA